MSDEPRLPQREKNKLYLAMVGSTLEARGFRSHPTMASCWIRTAVDLRSEAWLAAGPSTSSTAAALFLPATTVTRLDVEWLLNAVREAISSGSELSPVPAESIWLDADAVIREYVSKLASVDGERSYVFGPMLRHEFDAALSSMRSDLERYAVPWLEQGQELAGWLRLAACATYTPRGRGLVILGAALWLAGDPVAASTACLRGRSGPQPVSGAMSPEDESGVSYEDYARWFKTHRFEDFEEPLRAAMAAGAAAEE